MSDKIKTPTILNCCTFCQFYRHEEVGDSDYGAVYAKEATCSKYHDYDDEFEIEIPNFDRTIERDCCVLDFFQVLEVDNDLHQRYAAEMDKTGKMDETYSLFKTRYNC